MSDPLIIYIVDDDLICQFIFKKLIENLTPESQVHFFPDGLQALEFLGDHAARADQLPDLILVDINMPVMDGWQFVGEYAKIESQPGKKAALFMVSSSVDPVDVNRAKQWKEISGYVEKPLDPEKMAGILKAAGKNKRG